MKMLRDRLVPSTALLALLLLVTTCGEERLLAPEEPPVEAALSVAAVDAAAVPADDVVTLSDMLEDPFVHLLIGSLNNPVAAEAIRASLTAASGELSAYQPISAQLALVSAQSEIETYADEGEADADDVVTLAALRLIFGQADEQAVHDTDDGATEHGEAEEREILDEKPRRRVEQ